MAVPDSQSRLLRISRTNGLGKHATLKASGGALLLAVTDVCDASPRERRLMIKRGSFRDHTSENEIVTEKAQMITKRWRRKSLVAFLGILCLVLCASSGPPAVISDLMTGYTRATRIKEGMRQEEVWEILDVTFIGRAANYSKEDFDRLFGGTWTDSEPLYLGEAFPLGEIRIDYCDRRIMHKEVRYPTCAQILAHWSELFDGKTE